MVEWWAVRQLGQISNAYRIRRFPQRPSSKDLIEHHTYFPIGKIKGHTKRGMSFTGELEMSNTGGGYFQILQGRTLAMPLS